MGCKWVWVGVASRNVGDVRKGLCAWGARYVVSKLVQAVLHASQITDVREG